MALSLGSIVGVLLFELLLALVLEPAFPPGLLRRPRAAVPSLLASSRCFGNRLFSSNFRAETGRGLVLEEDIMASSAKSGLGFIGNSHILIVRKLR